MWDIACYTILFFTIAYLGKASIEKYYQQKLARKEQAEIRAAERNKRLQEKILKLVAQGMTSPLSLSSVLEPLGFTDDEIRRETNELISEGKLTSRFGY